MALVCEYLFISSKVYIFFAQKKMVVYWFNTRGGGGATHIYLDTGMCRSSGSLFLQKTPPLQFSVVNFDTASGVWKLQWWRPTRDPPS